jgi:hypothetical protein
MYDLTQTNIAVERLLEVTENPRHLFCSWRGPREVVDTGLI